MYYKSLEVPSIDSFKLSFPLDIVEVLNNNLLDHITNFKVNSTTGELLETKPIQENSLKHQYGDYHIHFAINNHFGDKRLIILINSKLLEFNYMQGISMENVEFIYNKLMEAKIFFVSFKDFLSKGFCSDIDIKKDVVFSSVDEFTNMIKILDKSTKPQTRKDKGSNPFNTATNKGIEWNNRKTSTFKHPFLKIYHKGIEVVNGKNAEYFKRYLKVDEVKNVVRVEATIKNYSAEGFKHGLKDNTLLSLLKLTTTELNAIIEHSVKSNLEQRIIEVKRKSSEEMKPSEIVYFHSLAFMVNQNIGVDEAINYLIKTLDSVSKSRTKKKLYMIYEREIKSEIYEVKSNNLSTFFNSIGWK
mgnify:CR=1 FL=1